MKNTPSLLAASMRIRPGLWAVGIGLSCFLVVALILACFQLPADWVGFNDGYIYGLFIKAYYLRWEFVAQDLQALAWYPPYFFYVFGKLIAALGIPHIGVAQIASFLVTYGFFPLFLYAAHRSFLPPVKAALLACLPLASFLLLPLEFRFILYSKPHECLALLGIPLCLALYAFHDPRNTASVRTRFLAGASLGFLFGVYPPFLVIPILVTGLAIAVRAGWNTVKGRPSRWLDGPSVGGAFLTALPFFVLVALNILTHKNLYGLFWTGDMYNASYLEPKLHNFWLFLGLIGACGALLFAPRLRRYEDAQTPLLWAMPLLGAMVALSFAAHAGFLIAFTYDVIVTEPKRYVFPVPFLAGYLLALFVAAALIKWPKLRGLARDGAPAALLLFALCGFAFAANVAPGMLMEQALSELSDARKKNVEPVMQAFLARTDLTRDSKPVYYLGFSEYSFLDYYILLPLVNYLVFNGSYAAAHENIAERGASLKAAVAAGPDALHAYLLARNIRYLFLANVPNGTIISSTYDTRYEMSKPIIIDLNEGKALDRLVKSGRIVKIFEAGGTGYEVMAPAKIPAKTAVAR